MQLEKFVDKLPVPGILNPASRYSNYTYYEVEMKQIKQKLHRDLPETTLWGYEGKYPGPTIEVNKNERVRVKWINDLPDKHILPVETAASTDSLGAAEVRTVVHVHGANVSPDSDGPPDAWFTRGFRETGPNFKKKVCEYTNGQSAAALWYHDNALGMAHLNVYAGLAGMYIIRDESEKKLNLPAGKYEIPLIIQDKSFNEDGSLFYPRRQNQSYSQVFLNHSINEGFEGNTMLVNGKIWPYLNVEPRKYRFKILNASNSRFYTLEFENEADINPPMLFQIGTDGGLLDIPEPVSKIVLAPSERADVVVDFSLCKGRNMRLINSGSSQADPVHDIMEFRVTLPLYEEDTSTIPSHLCPVIRVPEYFACRGRNIVIIEKTDEHGQKIFYPGGKAMDAAITEKPRLGTVEIWRFLNCGSTAHPIHIHLVQFQVLDRQPFDVRLYMDNGEIVFTGPAALPAINERGWKDTVRVYPGEAVRIIAQFESYSGIFSWHSCILEHEDRGLIRPFRVIMSQ